MNVGLFARHFHYPPSAEKRPQNFVVSEADFYFYFVLFDKKAVDNCL
jgi:hypothetical protein